MAHVGHTRGIRWEYEGYRRGLLVVSARPRCGSRGRLGVRRAGNTGASLGARMRSSCPSSVERSKNCSPFRRGASPENLLRVQDARETRRQKRTPGNAGPLIGGADQRCDSADVHELLVAVLACLDTVRGHSGFDQRVTNGAATLVGHVFVARCVFGAVKCYPYRRILLYVVREPQHVVVLE